MGMSRIRGPYVRFCERDEVNLIQFTSPYSIMAQADRDTIREEFRMRC